MFFRSVLAMVAWLILLANAGLRAEDRFFDSKGVKIHFVIEGQGEPVLFGFWMDGKLLHSMMVDTKPSGLVYFNPYSAEEMRLYLPEGDHVFRAGFINDDFVKGLSDKEAYNNKSNKYLESIAFEGVKFLKQNMAAAASGVK